MMNESRVRYTVTIYVAAPGTPRGNGETSVAGHVYYKISDAHHDRSYGFAPASHGASSGPGKVFKSDAEEYQSPLYARTMEVSQAQHQKLLNFGENPHLHGFNMEYQGATNSCIDFTWTALNHAGLHRTTARSIPDKDFEGSLKPLDNRDAIRSIRAPFPDSELNGEQHHPMPKRTLLQRFISEEDLQSPQPGQRSPSGDPAFDDVFFALQSHNELALESDYVRPADCRKWAHQDGVASHYYPSIQHFEFSGLVADFEVTDNNLGTPARSTRCRRWSPNDPTQERACTLSGCH